MSTGYRIQQFAELAGVTVRTLHHYDRLALLSPRRTEAGYRVYCLHDLERLEQIVALKFLGLSLRQIRELLDQKPRELSDVLRAQRLALEDKRRSLDQAIDAIRAAEAATRQGARPNASLLKTIIEVLDMQNDMESLKKYYSEEAWEKLAERRRNWTPEQEAQAAEGSKHWEELFSDIRSSLNEDPASPKAQELAERWRTLVGQFTGGDRDIEHGLKNLWSDQQNWSATLQAQAGPFTDKAVWEFIGKAMACRKS